MSLVKVVYNILLLMPVDYVYWFNSFMKVVNFCSEIKFRNNVTFSLYMCTLTQSTTEWNAGKNCKVCFLGHIFGMCPATDAWFSQGVSYN